MPPRRRTRPDPVDVEVLRARLSEGRLVRVGITPSSQFPEGVIGRVRRIGDPAVDGDEFVFVEVPVRGGKDVLPFGISDLIQPGPRALAAPAGSGKPRRINLAAASAPAAGPDTGPVLFPAQESAPQQDLRAPVSPARNLRVAAAPAEPTAIGGGSATTGARSASTADKSPATGAGARTTSTASTSTKRAARPKPPDAASDGPESPGATGKQDRSRGRRAPVTITVSTTGEDAAPWRIEARIGTRVAVRPTPVATARVWEIVQTLGDEKLSAAVAALLEERRRFAQARADALAAELATVQAELDAFPRQR